MIPRYYQSEACKSVNDYLDSHDPTDSPCVVLPTGSGKSFVMALLTKGWMEAYPDVRVMILAHRGELVQQNHDELMSIMPYGKMGIFAASLKKRDRKSQITYAMIDSVHKRASSFEAPHVILVDEAHRIPASGEGKYRKFIADMRKANPELRVVGLTATPYRTGMGPICHKDHVLTEICYEANVGTLINEGYLCRIRSKISKVQPDLSEVRKSNGEYVVKSLAAAVDREDLVRETIREAVTILRAEGRTSVMFFCVDVHHCELVSKELSRYNIHAPCVTGETRAIERQRICKGFIDGRIQAICNVEVYTEGFNAKRVDSIVLLRPTLSAGLFYQMVGRGLRQHESKQDCLILDYAHCIEEHGPIDMIDSGETRVITCGGCGDSFSRAVKVCPNCQWVVPKVQLEAQEREDVERRLHQAKASERSILSDSPEELTVDGVSTHLHVYSSGETALRVQYRAGRLSAWELVDLEHKGERGKKAAMWWWARFGSTAIPTVEHAVMDLFLAKQLEDMTNTVTVVRETNRRLKVIGHWLKNEKAGM